MSVLYSSEKELKKLSIAVQAFLLEGKLKCKHELILKYYLKLGNAGNKETAADFCCDSCYRAQIESSDGGPLQYAIKCMLNYHVGGTNRLFCF